MNALEMIEAIQVKDLLNNNSEEAGVFPALATWCALNERQAWSSPREMESDSVGSYPHGTIDLIADEGWARIWSDKDDPQNGFYAGWYNTHNGIRKAVSKT